MDGAWVSNSKMIVPSKLVFPESGTMHYTIQTHICSGPYSLILNFWDQLCFSIQNSGDFTEVNIVYALQQCIWITYLPQPGLGQPPRIKHINTASEKI